MCERAGGPDKAAAVRPRDLRAKRLNLTGVQCEKGLVHGGWQCLTVVGLFCGKHPPADEKKSKNKSKKQKQQVLLPDASSRRPPN